MDTRDIAAVGWVARLLVISAAVQRLITPAPSGVGVLRRIGVGSGVPNAGVRTGARRSDVLQVLLDVLGGVVGMRPRIPDHGEGLVAVHDRATVITETAARQRELGGEHRIGARRVRGHRRDIGGGEGGGTALARRDGHAEVAGLVVRVVRGDRARGVHVDHDGVGETGSEQRCGQRQRGRDDGQLQAPHQLPPTVRLRSSTTAPRVGS